MSSKTIFILLILAGLLIHLPFLAYPKQVVFDEVWFGEFIQHYYNGTYFFDIHPPFGKLLIFGLTKLAGVNVDSLNFAKIGNAYADNAYVVPRFLPNVAGALFPAATFFALLCLGLEREKSAFAALFVLLDNAFLAQTRFILLDGFLFLFGIMGVGLFFAARRRNYDGRLVVLAFAAFALAFSVKWTGLGFMLPALLTGALDVAARLRARAGGLVPLCAKLALGACVAGVLYFGFFAVHFALLPKPGPGDAYMSSTFRDKSLAQKFLELNMRMFTANQTLTATHPYASKWYGWPFMQKSISFWVSGNRQIALAGNPAVWLLALFGIVAAVYRLLPLGARQEAAGAPARAASAFLLFSWAANYAPFILISRLMFLYHYLPALWFSVALGVLHADNRFLRLYAVCAAAFFLIVSRVSYGF